MKRTKNINHDAFRKSRRLSRLTPVAIAISTVLMLSGCEEVSDQTVSMYQNAQDCSVANPNLTEQCTTAYNQAKAEALKTAPKYSSREDCVAEFGESQCTAVTPEEAGVTGQQYQQSGSMWMPLLAGYMFGRMMGGAGFASQPLFTSKNPASPASGRFVDATGRNYGAANYGKTMSVDKTALAPKPATTTTTTRGGFGESVAKQNALARSKASSSSSRSTSSSSRSYGG